MSSYGKAKKKSGTSVSRARNFVFTLNNYTPEDMLEIDRVATKLNTDYKMVGSDVVLQSEQRAVSYVIYGQEIGEEKTEHLQGYLQMPKRVTFADLRKWCSPLKRAHLEVAKGSAADNYKYCTKGGKYTEHGKISLTAGLSEYIPFHYLTHTEIDHYNYFSALYHPTLLSPAAAPLVEWDGPLPLIPFPLLPSSFFAPTRWYFD